MRQCKVLYVLVCLLFLSLFSLTAFAPLAHALTPINSCQILASANEVYELSADIVTAFSCLSLSSTNITVNGNGHRIIFSGVDSVYESAISISLTATSATIYNLTIDSQENVTGIEVTDGSSVLLHNITFNGSATNDRAISVTSAPHLHMTNLTLLNLGGTAITLSSATNTTISNILINKTAALLNASSSTTIALRNITYDTTDVASANSLLFRSSSQITVDNVSRAQTNLRLTFTGSSSLINLTNVSLSSVDFAGAPSSIRITNSQFTQSELVPINLTNVTTFYAENISVFNVTNTLINIHADPLVNATLLGYTLINISTTNASVLLFNQTSDATNISMVFKKTATPLFTVAGDLRINTFEETYGQINLSQPINGSGNFSQLFQIRNTSIIINDSILTRINQSINVTYFQLNTNNTNQRILQNSVLCFAPQCVNLSALNQTVAAYTFDRAANFTLIDLGVSPPHVATSIVAANIQTNNITWTWVNPTDIDFNGSQLFVDGINVANVSKNTTTYNLSTLSDATTYEFSVRSLDYDGYINTTFVGVSTTTIDDTTPTSVIGLLNASVISRDSLFFNWTLPTEIDFAHLRVMFNGVVFYNATNITNLTLTGLAPNTSYNLTITSYDINANTNATSNVSITTDDALTTTTISSCGTITTSGSYVVATPTLVSNYTCLYVRASTVTIDLNGSTLLYGQDNATTNASGIALTSISSITIQNGTITGNARFNLSQRAIFANTSTSVTLQSVNVTQSLVGIDAQGSTTLTFNDIHLTNTNTSILFNGSASQITLTNASITNTTIGLLFLNSNVASLTNITVNNATLIALNVSRQSLITINQFNWTLPTNRTSALLLDALNTTTFVNSSFTYGMSDTISVTNFSAGNLSDYIIAAYNGNLSISKRNFSAVTFRLNETPIDTFNITQAIYLGYNSVQVNATAYPFLNVSAQITFYDMAEGSPVYILRNDDVVNTGTTPASSSLTQLYDVSSPVINTTSLDGNYSLRGYTLKLLSPKNSTVITTTSTELVFFATATVNRTLAGCNLSLNGTNIAQFRTSDLVTSSVQSYSVSGLINGTNYTWAVNCLDNLSIQTIKTGNFTISIPPTTSSSSRSSGAFGSGSGASSPWINTFIRDSTELNQTFSISLKLYDGVRIRVNSNSHHVGIIGITDKDIEVNVSSTPQQARIAIGQSKTFILDENQTGGIIVTLNSIQNASRVNISISPTVVPITSNKSGSDTTATTDTTAAGSSGATTPAAPGASGTSGGLNKFVATKGIVVLVVIAGIVLACGLVYYFYLILRYRKGIAQPLNKLSAKKGLLAEFLFPFLPGGEFWKKKEDLVEAINGKGPKQADIERYAQTIVQLLPSAHIDHIESRLRVGNTFAYIEYELIENGYTHEQAKALIQQYQIDNYVRNCIYAGATNEQVREELQKAGWSPTWITKIFSKKPETTQSDVDVLQVPKPGGIFGNQQLGR